MADKNRKEKALRDFPSISEVLQDRRITSLAEKWSFELVSREVKQSANIIKKKEHYSNRVEAVNTIINYVLAIFAEYEAEAFKEVINGTGIILHTNLGRAPIFERYWDSVKGAVIGYSNLEFDTREGVRSKRAKVCHLMLATLAGTEDALIVNNNAASIYLAVANLSAGKEVIISRGQQIQIGGGFRIPEIIERTGCRMREIGTTNKTALGDYKKAINKNTGLILVVHRSNFYLKGFVEEPEIGEIVEIARRARIPLCYDIGSGLVSAGLLGTKNSEPDIKKAAKSGADLICFSGDKLLGGPQCGLIVGKHKIISGLAKDPLYRTFRPDKITIGLMELAIRDYLCDKSQNPVWTLVNTPVEILRSRGEKIIGSCKSRNLSLISIKSSLGGGSLPDYEIESIGILIPAETQALSERLRKFNPPVISRMTQKGVIIDLRAVFARQDEIIIRALNECLL